MKVIVHTEFDTFTYKAVGAAVGVLIYAVLAYKFRHFDLMVACLIAFLIGSLVWYVLSFLVIKRNGLCFEFRYSKNRPRFVSVTLLKKFKQLDYMEFELLVESGAQNQELDNQALDKFKHFITRYLSHLNECEEIHFVGCTEFEAKKICRLLEIQNYDGVNY
jgi:hypothetical protein